MFCCPHDYLRGALGNGSYRGEQATVKEDGDYE